MPYKTYGSVSVPYNDGDPLIVGDSQSYGYAKIYGGDSFYVADAYVSGFSGDQSGVITITGAGSSLTVQGVYYYGYNYGYGSIYIGDGTGTDGTVNVENGGLLEALGPYTPQTYDDSFISVGVYGGAGELNISGQSRVTVGSGGYLVAGSYGGTGTVNISGDSLLTAPGAGFGYGPGGVGTLTITGQNSQAVAGGYGEHFYDLYDVYSGGQFIFGGEGGKGYLSITDGGSLRAVGDSLQTGGLPTYSPAVLFGNYVGSYGRGDIDGAGSEIRVDQYGPANDRGGVAVGYNGGVGKVYLTNGASITVTGDKATLLVGESYYYEGQGARKYTAPAAESLLSVYSGSTVLVDSGSYGESAISIGQSALSNGALVVSGASSSVTVTSGTDIVDDSFTGSVTVGYVGEGFLGVYDDATVNARSLRVGLASSFYDGAYFQTFTGANAGFDAATYKYSGTGSVLISGGGQVLVSPSASAPYPGVVVGETTGTVGYVTVTGEGSLLRSGGGAGQVRVGANGKGYLEALSGAQVDGFFFDIGRNGSGYVYVDGVGSGITASDEFGAFATDPGEAGFFRLGRNDGGYGLLKVTNGGRVDVINDPNYGYDNPVFQIARNNGATGYALISGYVSQNNQFYYSTLNIEQTGPVGEPFATGGIGPYGPRLVVGSGGQGLMTVDQNAQVTVTGANARLVVAGGRGDNTSATSQLKIQGGADVIVDGLGYGGNQPYSDDLGGTVNVNLGPQVRIAGEAGTYGYIGVSGEGSTLEVSSTSTVSGDYANSQIVVGAGGVGELAVSDGGFVTARGLRVGEGAGSRGDVTISANGGVATGIEIVSTDGTPYQGVRIGANGGDGYATVTGDGAVLTSRGGVGRIQVGGDTSSFTHGHLNVNYGGRVEAHMLEAGRAYGSEGAIYVDGLGSEIYLSDEFGDFVYPGEAGRGGFLRLGRDSGSNGSLAVTNGGLVTVTNDPTGDFDNPLALLGQYEGAVGTATISGYAIDPQTTDRVYSALRITQTGPVGEPYSRGDAKPRGPQLIVGSGGQGFVSADNGAQIEVSGAGARLIVAAGRRDQYGNPITTPYSSSLGIYSGADVLVDSGAYGGTADIYNPDTQGTFTAYLGAQVRVGDDLGATGFLRIDGQGSTLTVASTSNVAEDYSTGNVVIGSNDGTGFLDVSNDGALYARSLRVGSNFGNGPGAFGAVSVESGGYVLLEGQIGTPYQGLRIGEAGGVGVMTVDGYGGPSIVVSRGADGLSPGVIRVGSGGDGSLAIQNGGQVYGSFVQVGRDQDGQDGDGTITIDGAGGYNSRLFVSDAYGQFVDSPGVGGFVRIGQDAGSYGRINVKNGGELTVVTDPVLDRSDFAVVTLGKEVGSTGVLEVYGGGVGLTSSSVNIRTYGSTSDDLYPGSYYGPLLRLGRYGGEGIVNIRDYGVVNVVGESAGVSVGLGGQYAYAGANDQSVLTISANGVLNVDSRDQEIGANYQDGAQVGVGVEAGGNGRIVVTGNGSELNIFSNNADDISTDPDAPFPGVQLGAGMLVGGDGRGELLVDDNALVNIDGYDDAFPFFVVGYGDSSYYAPGYGQAIVTNGGRIAITGANNGVAGNAAYQTGTSGLILIGANYGAFGSLTVSNGGAVYNSNFSSTGLIGLAPGSFGEMLVTGAGSYVFAGTRFGVGASVNFSNGAFNAANAGTGVVSIEDNAVVAAGETTVGVSSFMNIDNATLDTTLNVAGVLTPGQYDGIGTATVEGIVNVSVGSIFIEVDGFTAPEADFLTVTGNLNVLDGAINIDLSGMTAPQTGSEIAFLQASNIGFFDIETEVTISGFTAPVGAEFSVEQRTVLVGQQNVQQLFLLFEEVFDNRVAVTDPAANVLEGDPGDVVSIAFEVTRSGDLNQSMTIDWAATGTGANPADVADFPGPSLPLTGQFTFGVGQDTGTILVPLVEDFNVEPDEGVQLTISNPALSGGDGVTIDNATSTALILNDDFAPVAVDDPNGGGAFQTGENTPLPIAEAILLANDFDDDIGQTFEINSINPGGDAGFSAEGAPLFFDGATVIYGFGLDTSTLFDSLAEGEILADSFTYDLIDASGAVSAPATVFVEIIGVNDAPVAIAGSATTEEDTALNGQLEATDVDNDLADLTFSLNVEGDPANGTVTINADGSFIYTPGLDFVGTDSFDFDVSDGIDTVTETFSVTVTEASEVFFTGDFALTAPAGGRVAITGVDLTATELGIDPSLIIYTASNITGGQLVFATDPGVAITSFTQADIDARCVQFENFDGQPGGSFTVTVTDQFGVPATQSVTVTDAATPPLAPVNAGDLFVDVDPGLSAAVTSADLGATSVGNAAADITYHVISAANGFLAFSATPATPIDLFTQADVDAGAIIFVHDGAAGVDAGADLFITDQEGDVTGPVTLDVNVLRPPVAADDSFLTDEDTAFTGNLFADNGFGLDSDPNGDQLTVTEIAGLAIAVGNPIQLPSGAVMQIDANGDITYDPTGALDFLPVGDDVLEQFDYTISDGFGGTSTASVSISVDGVNDAPVAVDDVAATDEETPVLIDVLGNDTDVDGVTLTVSGQVNGPSFGFADVVTDFQFFGPGQQFDPNNALGAPDNQFVALPVSSTITVAFADEFVSDAPNQDDLIIHQYVGSEQARIEVSSDGVNFEILGTAAGTTSFDLASIGFAGNVTHVRVTGLDNGGSFPGFDLDAVQAIGDGLRQGLVFDPRGSFDSLAEGEITVVSATYEVQDDQGAVDSGQALVTLTGVNDAPVAVADTLAATERNGTFIPDDFVLNPENGHYYKYVDVFVDYAQALAGAEALGGHLATITSQSENDFIDGLVPGDAWLGGSDIDVEGTWVWDGGPELDDVFWIGDANGASPTFANWAPSEPNDAGGNEDAVHIGSTGQWNDLPVTSLLRYVVEISDVGFLSDPFTGSVAANDVDVDAGPNELVYTLEAPVDGLFLATDGTYEFYSNHPTYDDLEDGDTLTITANYTVTDGFGASDSSVLTITLAGADEFTPFLGDDDADLILGTEGEDLIDAQGGNDFLSGLGGQDTILGGDGNDVARGGAGQDSIEGGADNDKLFGELGDDILNGDGGDDQIRGIFGNDSISGGVGNDILGGGADSDTLDGGDGLDTIQGGPGDDFVYGGDDDDLLRGGSGADQLFGELGSDRLSGGIGDDTLDGGVGDDTLRGREGDDELTGGSGVDRFTFITGDGSDVITDFEQGIDEIRILDGASAFGDLTIVGIGVDVQITFADVTITLLDQQPGDFTAGDFIF